MHHFVTRPPRITDEPPPYHVFTKTGAARPEVEEVLEKLAVSAPEPAGNEKSIYVTRANQTVVFLTGTATPLATALRGRKGWQEPEK